MTSRLFCCLFLLFLFSCSSKDKTPVGIIDPQEMKPLMWDVIRADALAGEIAKKDSLINDTTETKLLTQKVFELHKITENDFNKSYEWYIKHPEVMKIIFDSLYSQKQKSFHEIRTSGIIIKDTIPYKNLLYKKSRNKVWLPDSLSHFKK